MVYVWKELIRREPYPYHILGIRGLEKEESRSSTHELARSRVTKVLALRPSCGRMEM
jgi:hypothetical protein